MAAIAGAASPDRNAERQTTHRFMEAPIFSTVKALGIVRCEL
jgi:hypothetical protein